MNKNFAKKNYKEIKNISNKMPKSLNEVINFEENEMDNEEMPMNEPTMPHEKHSNDDHMDVASFVDDIRKKSLRGMAQLAENPDDERYQLLKKIWQICDKKPEQQTAFSNPNANQQNMQQKQF